MMHASRPQRPSAQVISALPVQASPLIVNPIAIRRSSWPHLTIRMIGYGPGTDLRLLFTASCAPIAWDEPASSSAEGAIHPATYSRTRISELKKP